MAPAIPIAGGLRVLLGLFALACLSAPCLPAMGAQAPATGASLSDLDFDWRDEQGAVTRLSRWDGETILLTMAYSTCRQVCSFTLHRLEELQQSADRAGAAIQVVVISYDPNIDGPQSWSIYRHHHHLDRANWHFLTGEAADTRRFAAAMRFPYWSYDDHIVHDFRILLIGPDGRIVRSLTWASHNDDPFTPATVRCPSAGARGCSP